MTTHQGYTAKIVKLQELAEAARKNKLAGARLGAKVRPAIWTRIGAVVAVESLTQVFVCSIARRGRAFVAIPDQASEVLNASARVQMADRTPALRDLSDTWPRIWHNRR